MGRKALAALACALVLVVGACTGGAQPGGGNTGATGAGKGTVGISMPARSAQRWATDGAHMVREFERLGYRTDLQYADDVVEQQVSQINTMLTTGVKLLVIAAIDTTSLTSVLNTARSTGVTVVAYDRLIQQTPNVDYYAAFDAVRVGVLQARYIEDRLGLKAGRGPFNIELFAGSLDENDARLHFDGAMSVLGPYLKSGRLVVRSGQTKIEQAATARWEGSAAQARMDNLLSGSYSGARIDAVLSPRDAMSIGIISSLKLAGYGTAARPLPIITGQDAEKASVKSIIAGEQAQTVYKDTRELARTAAGMADAVLSGRQPRVTDTGRYDNGVKKVPSCLLEPVPVDRSNYRKVLVESGYYTESDLA